MTDKHVRIDQGNYEALSEISKDTDVPIVRLVNKAIREWLEKQSEVKDERK
jgi:hypothetical protein